MVFIEKEAKNKNRNSFPRYFTASARAAFTHILQVRRKSDSRGILLPSYIGLSKIEGSGVFDPIRKSGISSSFYYVDRLLVPDFADIERQLKTGKFQLVLLIHYFGFAQVDVTAFVKLCRQYGALVIEDCAHSILGGLGEKRLGFYGDYSIFSIHKNTSTRDGGFYYDLTGDVSSVALPNQNRIASATLEEFACVDLQRGCEVRVKNYEAVERWVKQFPELELFAPRRAVGEVPLNCPVIVAKGKREELYFKLQEKGVLATALYHTLIPEITKDAYPDSVFVAGNILNLPTHPDINTNKLEKYSQIFRSCVKEVFS